jgi:hypothetical protein
MVSLALIVSIIFLIIILLGPISYLLAIFPWVPTIVVYIVSLTAISCGLWWIVIVVTFARFIGLLPIYLGIISILKRS